MLWLELLYIKWYHDVTYLSILTRLNYNGCQQTDDILEIYIKKKTDEIPRRACRFVKSYNTTENYQYMYIETCKL